MKKTILPILLMLVFAGVAKSQTFNFAFTSDNADNQGYSYVLNSTIKITGVKITQIYYDDHMNSGSFAYVLVTSYDNKVTGSRIPTGNFYTFHTDISSNKGSQALAQSFQSIPITTGTGFLEIGNNPTFSGSASSMGYVAGQTYSDAATLARFSYFSMDLSVAGPSLGETKKSGIGVLPVTLASFTANQVGGNVIINWSTATEVNNSFFTIERSSNTANFAAIQKISGKGNITSLTNYAYTDVTPLAGVAYYRLKQTDVDGQFVYSNTIAVINNATPQITVYPTINPTNTIRFTGVTTNKTLDVFSLTGARLFTSKLQGSQLVLPSLPKGVYNLRITGLDKTSQVTKYIQQ